VADGRLRIIGGRYRGRRLPVPVQPGLRPTGDRIRETLFNWLAPVIEGAHCLDLFAGSGALGFEAASRGAAEVVMLEQAAAVVRILEANAKPLGASALRVVHGEALQWLQRPADRTFDIVFLDPPFASGLLQPTCDLLARHRWLAPRALVYLEASAQDELPALPGTWELLRDKRAGQVRYALAMAPGQGSAPGVWPKSAAQSLGPT
jgi:16S rRNA (guanine966-N2)-methyltransferase